MNEHEAEKRIRRAVTEKTAFLDGLPSQEKEILERIPTEDENMTIAYGKTRVFPAGRRKTGWQGWIRPLAAACAMVILAACIGLWMNGANQPDEVKSTPAMQPEEMPGMAAVVPAGTPDGKEAAADVPLDRVDLYVDPALLYDPENGLLATGEDVVKKPGQLPFQGTVYRWHYDHGTTLDGEMTYTSGEKGTGFQQAVRLQLGGGDYGLDMPQKALQITAAEGTFEYALFDDRPYPSYRSFLLSNADGDSMFTRVADPVQHRMVERYLDTGLLTLAWRPVNVYINNEYQGIYNMRETMDQYTMAHHEGLPEEEADSINILTISGYIEHGDNRGFREMVRELKGKKPGENPEDLAYLEEQVDTESFLDWLAVAVYYGNSDVGTGLRYYQVPGGKWKCALYRLHYGLFASDYNSVKLYLQEEGMGVQELDNTVFRKILEADTYRERFLEKLGNLYRTLNTETMRKELDACVAWIMPDMRAHIDRWAPYYDKYVISDVPTDPDEAWRYWQKRVVRMHNTMTKRPNLLYGFVQEYFELSDAEMEKYFGPKAEQGEEILSIEQVFGEE
ncbi:CotH kinase family protein [Clostridiales bacterium]|nr:CotH kinase family protein [Clostridiales bacterium]